MTGEEVGLTRSYSQLSTHANQAGMSFSARSEGTQASGLKEISCQTGDQEEEVKLKVLEGSVVSWCQMCY